MGKSDTLKTSHIRFGKRSYFFDVNQKQGSEIKYLRITESQYQGEGKERKYNSFILFPEEVKDFMDSLNGALESFGEN